MSDYLCPDRHRDKYKDRGLNWYDSITAPIFPYDSSEDSTDDITDENLKPDKKIETLPKKERERLVKKIIEGANEKFNKCQEDVCLNCLRPNYEKNKSEQCRICGITTCTYCSYKHSKKGRICYEHQEAEYKYKGMTIEEKLESYKARDKCKFGRTGDIDITYVMNQLEKQKGKCYICDDPVWCSGSSGCHYLISVDRMDNDSPHDKDNCLIACNYCNCRAYYYKKLGIDHKKVCTYGCHNIERELPLKEDVLEQLAGERMPERFTW